MYWAKDFVGRHAGNKAHGDLGDGFGWDDGFGAGTGESAGDAVDIEGGASPGALENAEAAFADELAGADFGDAVMLFVEGQALPGGEFLGAGRDDVVVEAGNQDVAVFVFEAGDDLREGDEGIGRRAAVHAGVEIGFGAADFEFGVDHAAQADAEGGQAGGEEFGIGDEREVSLEIGGLGGDVVGNSLPSHFFFAFKEDADIERERFVGRRAGIRGL